MTEPHRLSISPVSAAIALVVMVLAGAGTMYLVMREGRRPNAAPAIDPVPAPSPPIASPVESAASPLPDVVVPLTKEAVEGARIELSQVTTQAVAVNLRVPAVVEPNAYRQVAVTPLVTGRVVSTSVQLGTHVRKGQTLAEVYSPDVAEARTKYVSAKAMFAAHDRELQRTAQLVEIGAASRQELERLDAEHAAQLADVESARSRLQLLGADVNKSVSSSSQEDAITHVRAPIDGVVTERLANAGVNVDPTMKLFTIVDLSTVWIVADVYERDLARVREGTRASVTTAVYPERVFEGRVSFIDPQLSTATRTAQVRVEVPNPHGDLKLGMYADIALASPETSSVVSVPREAIQDVGDRHFVYVASADNPLTFIEREVRAGRAFGDRVEVLAGLSPGDSVVSHGTFFVRAEAERLGLRSSQPAPTSSPVADATVRSAGIQGARISVSDKGFEPARVMVRAGSMARLTFVRTTDDTCGRDVVFPSLSIERALPLREPVAIEFTPQKTGEITFMCGGNMFKGTVVIQ